MRKEENYIQVSKSIVRVELPFVTVPSKTEIV